MDGGRVMFHLLLVILCSLIIYNIIEVFKENE